MTQASIKFLLEQLGFQNGDLARLTRQFTETEDILNDLNIAREVVEHAPALTNARANAHYLSGVENVTQDLDEKIANLNNELTPYKTVEQELCERFGGEHILDAVENLDKILEKLKQADMVASGGDGPDQCTLGCSSPGARHKPDCPWEVLDGDPG